MHTIPDSPRYHRIDGWRGYRIPTLAVAGSSDCGSWEDSPAPTDSVGDELERFRKEALRPAGIRSRIRYGTTSNVFCGKRWLTVAREDFERAAQITVDWLESQGNRLNYLHDADLDALGFHPEGQQA